MMLNYDVLELWCLKITVPPALILPKMYHTEITQTDLHVFYAQRKIGE